MGAAVSRVIGPLMGYSKRVRANVNLVMPDMEEADIKALIRGTTDNVGRTIAEMYSGKEFTDRCAAMAISGPGLKALEDSKAAGKGAVLITAHFGNYDAPRAALIGRGYNIAALYRPMNNRVFNEHYLQAMQSIGPTFPRSKGGTTGLVRHLKNGGMAEFLIDQYFPKGEDLTFFGHPAKTSTVPAELSLRYDVPLVPMYGVRKPDGVGFDLVLEAPIEKSDARTMTQALNDSLEALTKSHMPQWMWVHRRWR